MVTAITKPGLEPLLTELSTSHRHLCPRQVLGVRMGLHAADLFPIKLPQRGKRLLTFVETDGCFADGVSVATGCSMGHRTMRLVDQGKVAATFVDTLSGKAVRCWPSPNARIHAVECVPAAKSRWHAQLEAYQHMSTEELIRVQEVALCLDLNAIIGKPGIRKACSVCGEEIINQREVAINGQPTCRSCAGDRYWTAKK